MPSPAPFSQDISKQIFDMLGADAAQKVYVDTALSISTELAKFGIKVGKNAIDAGRAVLKAGLDQVQDYEDKIVDVYGDISTQQEAYGKSAAKMMVEHADALRQEFLQMETGGVRMLDVFKDADEAAKYAEQIIGNFQGAARQFTDELTGANLVMTEFLSKAAGLSGEQTSAIMKIAKARGEDSKQMMADIGVFSKTLADKFGLDTKRISQSVVEITRDASTFGKVSVEAATVAATKFEAMGVSMQQVAGSIGSTFQSFEGAASAASKLSQVFGVNIDAMQMMIDVNSGPEGMVNAVDTLRESLIGAGVDASELSPPLRRLIKEMTGVQDDATIESLFDPDRIGLETDDILESAKKAAEAQKGPADAIKFLDNDISKVHRSLSDLNLLIEKQALARLGTQARGASLAMADLASASARVLDTAQQYGEKKISPALTGAIKTGQAVAAGAQSAASGFDQRIRAQYEAETGQNIARPMEMDREIALRAGRGAWEDKKYQEITGYAGGTQATVEREATRTALNTAAKVYNDSRSTDAEKQAAVTAFTDTLAGQGVSPTMIDALTNMLNPQAKATASAGTPPATTTPPGGTPAPTGPAVVTPAPGGTAAAVTATQVATAVPASPVATTAATIKSAPVAAATAPVASAASAPVAAPGAAPTATNAVNTTSPAKTTAGTPVGTVATTGTIPAGTNLNINVYLDPAKVVAAGGALVTSR